jgi:hypothetical protein
MIQWKLEQRRRPGPQIECNAIQIDSHDSQRKYVRTNTTELDGHAHRWDFCIVPTGSSCSKHTPGK